MDKVKGFGKFLKSVVVNKDETPHSSKEVSKKSDDVPQFQISHNSDVLREEEARNRRATGGSILVEQSQQNDFFTKAMDREDYSQSIRVKNASEFEQLINPPSKPSNFSLAQRDKKQNLVSKDVSLFDLANSDSPSKLIEEDESKSPGDNIDQVELFEQHLQESKDAQTNQFKHRQRLDTHNVFTQKRQEVNRKAIRIDESEFHGISLKFKKDIQKDDPSLKLISHPSFELKKDKSLDNSSKNINEATPNKKSTINEDASSFFTVSNARTSSTPSMQQDVAPQLENNPNLFQVSNESEKKIVMMDFQDMDLVEKQREKEKERLNEIRKAKELKEQRIRDFEKLKQQERDFEKEKQRIIAQEREEREKQLKIEKDLERQIERDKEKERKRILALGKQKAAESQEEEVDLNSIKKKMISGMYSQKEEKVVEEKEIVHVNIDNLSDTSDSEYIDYCSMLQQALKFPQARQKNSQLQLSSLDSLPFKQNHLRENDYIDYHYMKMHLAYFQQQEGADEQIERMVKQAQEETWNEKDFLSKVDWNERRHQAVALKQLKENSVISLKNVKIKQVPLSLLSEVTLLHKVSNFLLSEKQYHEARATCVAVSNNFIFVGSAIGSLMIFNRETEAKYKMFQDNSKEYEGVAITAIDIHPIKTEFAVIGYDKGWLTLLDVTDLKKLKVIKDHHSGIPISNIKFCDWHGGKALEQASSNKNSNKHIWMFISIDALGRVIVNTVEKILIVYQSSKHVIIDPNKVNAPMFNALAVRLEQAQQITMVRKQGEGRPESEIDGALIALGNTETVYILRIKPNFHEELFRVDRVKKYFSKKENKLKDTVPKLPSLSWGVGHTPRLNDRQYPLLAIGWGPSIQLLAVNDLRIRDQSFVTDGFCLLTPEAESEQFQKLKSDRAPAPNSNALVESDQAYQRRKSIIYQINSLSIEEISFMSENTILVLTSDLEIRILFTEYFKTGDLQREGAEEADGGQVDPVLEQGVRISGVAKAEYGANYHQTIKLFNGLLIVLTDKGLCKAFQYSWMQSLIEFKKHVKHDWMQVFAKSLEFYNGKIKGFIGVSDVKAIREREMKEDIKLLMRDIIMEMMVRFNVQTMMSSVSLTEEGAVEDKGVEEEKETNEHNYQTLIRIAIEFCVELEEFYFLFHDLFNMFQDESMEKQFIEELEPFIIAGKFLNWQLPVEILQNQLLKFYKQNSHPENLEKVLINLNLSSCPKEVISELIHFSQQHVLSTSILFLMTQAFDKKDNSSCIEVLFQLFDLYKKAGKQNKGAIQNIQNLENLDVGTEEHKQTEKSQLYLGYKLMWVIQLFLAGKKFPRGEISHSKLSPYINDTIQFILTKDILLALLKTDSKTFFQLISVVFIDGQTCELVSVGQEGDPKDEEGLGQKDLMIILDEVILQNYEIDEEIRMNYLYFIINVASKCKLIENNKLYFKVALDLIRHQERYLKFNSELYLAVAKDLDKELSVIKSEDLIISLIEICQPLSDHKIQELQQASENTQLLQLKVYIYDQKEEYSKCLEIIFGSMKQSATYQSPAMKTRIFQWLRTKIMFLHAKQMEALGAGNEQRVYDQFKKEIQLNIKQMVEIDPAETVNLVDDEFGQNHKYIIDSLPKELDKLAYLVAFLKEKEKIIQETIREYSLQSTNPKEAKKYIEFMKHHLRLCCQLKKDQVLQKIEELVKQHYQPNEEYLIICQEYNQTEACALINKKLGKYYESVGMYIKTLKQTVPIKKLMYELYEAKKRGIPTDYCINNEQILPFCTKLDQILNKVTNICKKNYKEVDIGKEDLIWYEVLETLYEFKTHAKAYYKTFWKEYFDKRINLFTIELVKCISFKDFYEKFALRQKNVKFQDLKGVLYDIFSDLKSEFVLFSDAKNQIFNQNAFNSKVLFQDKGVGVLYDQYRCCLCQYLLESTLEDPYLNMVQRWIKDDRENNLFNEYDKDNFIVRIFLCQHTFHERCLVWNNEWRDVRSNMPKSSGEDDVIKCPECNKKDYSIIIERSSPDRSGRNVQMGELGQKSSRHKQQMSMSSSSNSPLKFKEEGSPEGQKQGSVEKGPEIVRSETIVRQSNKAYKKLKLFDQKLEQESIDNLGNYRQQKEESRMESTADLWKNIITGK